MHKHHTYTNKKKQQHWLYIDMAANLINKYFEAEKSLSKKKPKNKK